MPNKKYIAGRRLEYLMKEQLEEMGFFVIRAAGSHGVDLVAIWRNMQVEGLEHHRILFVSCKKAQYMTPEERHDLLNMAFRFGAIAMMTIKVKRKWELMEVKQKIETPVRESSIVDQSA